MEKKDKNHFIDSKHKLSENNKFYGTNLFRRFEFVKTKEKEPRISKPKQQAKVNLFTTSRWILARQGENIICRAIGTQTHTIALLQLIVSCCIQMTAFLLTRGLKGTNILILLLTTQRLSRRLKSCCFC